MNPVERVFEEVRRWVEGRVYGSIEEKVAAVNACLSGLESDPERVKSLVGWGVDQAERSGAARTLYGLFKLKWYYR